MKKIFHISDVLSVTTGRLVSTRHIDGVYDIMGWLTQSPITTIGLLVANDVCKAELLRQYPRLEKVEVPDEFRNEAHVWSWVAEQEEIFGETLSVSPLAHYDAKDPITEAVEYMQEHNPNAEIMVVGLD